jgi:ATP-dependent Lon protease
MGEITLLEQVLPIGGVRKICRPSQRAQDGHPAGTQHTPDVPGEIKESMQFVFVQTVDDVLGAALEQAPAPAPKTRAKGPAAASKPAKKKGKPNGKNPSGRR